MKGDEIDIAVDLGLGDAHGSGHGDLDHGHSTFQCRDQRAGHQQQRGRHAYSEQH